MASIERARAKHNGLTAQLAKINDKLDKMDSTRSRLLKKKDAFIRAIARSAKRLDKLAIVTHNGGPTATPLPKVITAIDAKPAAPLPDDPVPEFVRRGQAAQAAVDALTKPTRGARKRRTPDDFAADLKNKKSRQRQADGLS